MDVQLSNHYLWISKGSSRTQITLCHRIFSIDLVYSQRVYYSTILVSQILFRPTASVQINILFSHTMALVLPVWGTWLKHSFVQHVIVLFIVFLIRFKKAKVYRAESLYHVCGLFQVS